jgi:hypothetical protein
MVKRLVGPLPGLWRIPDGVHRAGPSAMGGGMIFSTELGGRTTGREGDDQKAAIALPRGSALTESGACFPNEGQPRLHLTG